jgi:hypothetical protein
MYDGGEKNADWVEITALIGATIVDQRMASGVVR